MDSALCRRFDVGLYDLDGVIYSGTESIAHAADSVGSAVDAGMQAAFVTNNASRTPEQVADRIHQAGVAATTEQIITSAQVAADVLAARLPAGSPVLVVGAEGLHKAVADRGLGVVAAASDGPAAVVQGHDPDTSWRRLAEATAAVRAGALWVATNRDSTLPSEMGILPGNGAFVKVLADVLGRQPDVVAGKPDRAMHQASVRRTAARSPLVIGDRLDTDIEGAVNAGCPSLLVMTGVTTPDLLYAAEPNRRPTFLAADLRGLLEEGRSFEDAAADRSAGAWAADKNGSVTHVGEGDQSDELDLLRLLCALSWAGQRPAAGDPVVERAIARLGVHVDATG